VVERGRIGERWRTERWHGLRFQFPNWSVRLPDFPFPHSDPDAFATAGEIVDFLTAYSNFAAVPIRCGVTVTALRRRDGAFVAETSAGSIAAENVIVATGPYQRPMIPTSLPDGNGLFQLHASRYRDPDHLHSGAVLIVGSGTSGAQIAEELVRAGRQVYLSIGSHRRMPRRYRGHDLIWWLSTLGLDQTPVEKRGSDRAMPLITGAYGGHTIDFRDFAARGMILLGRVRALKNGIVELAPDLAASLAHGDAAYFALLDTIDMHIASHGLTLPEEPGARTVRADPPCVTEPLDRLDLRAAGISTVIWATGYRCDLDWIDLPILDASGEPVHLGGITAVPGLYFLGLQWLSKMKSSFLSGVGDDGARLADHIAERSRAVAP
jgi:putative flavoprotein involved in K+ transport